jgi:UrcA family protein
MKTQISRNTKHIALTAIAALCLTSLAAHADETANDAPTLTVRYSDLDLGTQAGATALYNRIRHAAEQVCGDR